MDDLAGNASSPNLSRSLFGGAKKEKALEVVMCATGTRLQQKYCGSGQQNAPRAAVFEAVNMITTPSSGCKQLRLRDASFRESMVISSTWARGAGLDVIPRSISSDVCVILTCRLASPWVGASLRAK